jgi:hypothetical protein
LTAQNTDLHKTIEKLNSCFLTFTDDLVASGWLSQDPQVTKSLQRTIEHFITVVRESHTCEEDSLTAHDEDDFESAATKSPAPDDTEDASPSAVTPVDESTITVSSTEIHPGTTIRHLNTTFGIPYNTAASEHMDIQSVRNNAISEASYGPTSFEDIPFEFVSFLNDVLNYKPELTRPLNLPKPTFAQKLHTEAIRTGLHLVCNAEDSSQLFFRVFNRVLDLPTREGYRARLTRILDENSNRLLQPPPANDLDKLWSGESSVWLNASDVANHFRSIGMDFDSSPDIADEVTDPNYLPTWTDMQDLPATGIDTISSDGFAKSPHQQPPHDMTYLSSTSYQHFTGAAQGANEFGISARHPTHNTRGYGRSFMPVDVSSVDVSKLIRGEYLSLRPGDLNLANMNAKRSYKGHVVTATIRHSTKTICMLHS